MNGLKKIVIILIITNTVSFANLSKEQLLEYYNIAWGIKIFKQIEEERYNNLFIELNIDRNITNLKKIEKMKEFAYCKDASNAFLKEIRKITNEEYSDIISFYQSDIGKKVVQAYLKYTNSKIGTIYQKEKEFSKKKYLLIESISKELNIVELKVQYEVRRIMVQKFYETQQDYSDKYLQEYASKLRIQIKEHERQQKIIIFQNFTIPELEIVLEYAKTKAAKREMKTFFHGMGKAYSKQVLLCSFFLENFIQMPNHE
ncbi:MAG: Unknown protein [uncultured Sulfurovum sp.]|uniref:DUF2059 domain-containing protein n=1 Tax=uncultured Sulfurovum sp. TaxID=269237 RepID=A0A6S6RT00_9BACT|nr:MAG: Unknown protein [uncultured Sulfurovum sp.]